MGAKKGVHIALIKLGLIDVSDKHNKESGLTVKYNANHAPKAIHDVLIEYGYIMSTHTTSGHPMKPYLAYKNDVFKGCNIVLHHRDDKIFYITFDYRTNSYD
jgi:hypothetical protein